MGRGRAKAKQTKVARQLKYGGPTTDLERLQAELVGASSDDDDGDSGVDDPYAKYTDSEAGLDGAAEAEDDDR